MNLQRHVIVSRAHVWQQKHIYIFSPTDPKSSRSRLFHIRCSEVTPWLCSCGIRFICNSIFKETRLMNTARPRRDYRGAMFNVPQRITALKSIALVKSVISDNCWRLREHKQLSFNLRREYWDEVYSKGAGRMPSIQVCTTSAYWRSECCRGSVSSRTHTDIPSLYFALSCHSWPKRWTDV